MAKRNRGSHDSMMPLASEPSMLLFTICSAAFRCDCLVNQWELSSSGGLSFGFEIEIDWAARCGPWIQV